MTFVSEEFHRKIRKLTSGFALDSFKGHDDQTINSNVIYNSVAGGQIYNKLNVTFNPTQGKKGNSNGHSMSRCIFYFLKLLLTKVLNTWESTNYAEFKLQAKISLDVRCKYISFLLGQYFQFPHTRSTRPDLRIH